MENDAEKVMREVFGFEAMRPHQANLIDAILQGRDCLAVMPTGSGKSFCYALPSIMRPGLTLVISPLIALIRDQLQRFQSLGISCASLDSLQTRDEKQQVWDAMQDGSLKLLFLSPERLCRVDFRQALRRLDVQMVAVDEAHCISHWGQNFRPEYRKIGEYLAEIGDVQKIALTATATSEVRRDIVDSLRLEDPHEVWASFVRSNLQMKILKTSKVSEQLQTTLQAVLQSEGSGIVYVPTRKNAVEVERMLLDAGVQARAYHAGLNGQRRMATQDEFLSGKTRVVVATQAFGMGIHKADIRFVHHCGLPANLEQYIQEAGRAGRDGLPAKCWLIYSLRDYHIRKYMLERSLPERAELAEVFEAASQMLVDGRGRSRQQLVHDLTTALAGDGRQIDSVVEILAREGLIMRLTSRDAMREEQFVEGEMSAAEVADYLDDVPRLRSDAFAKLDALRSYVSLSGGQEQFLQDYFRPEL